MGDGSRDEKERIRAFAESYARKKGYRLNPDPEELDLVLEGLLANKRTWGRQYCPCRPVTGDPEEDRPKICPCKWHEEEIARDGHCHCRLFFRGIGDEQAR